MFSWHLSKYIVINKCSLSLLSLIEDFFLPPCSLKSRLVFIFSWYLWLLLNTFLQLIASFGLFLWCCRFNGSKKWPTIRDKGRFYYEKAGPRCKRLSSARWNCMHTAVLRYRSTLKVCWMDVSGFIGVPKCSSFQRSFS